MRVAFLNAHYKRLKRTTHVEMEFVWSIIYCELSPTKTLKTLNHELLIYKWTQCHASLQNTKHLLFIKLNSSLSFHNIGLVVISRSALLISEFTCSLSSMWLRSRPLAWAIRFPATRFPTITEAGPTSAKKKKKTRNIYLLRVFYVTNTMLYNTHKGLCTRLFLSGFGQVGDAGVRAHEDAAGV